MIILGLIFVAAAAVVAVTLIVQNRSPMVDVRGFGQVWHVHEYWLLITGLIVLAVALLGFVMMSGGIAARRHARAERRALRIENERLLEAAPASTTAPAAPPYRQAEDDSTPNQPRHRRHWMRSRHV